MVFKMAAWQWALVVTVAVASVGYMATAILGMFPADPANAGLVRASTPLETGFVGAQPQAGQHAFDGWSYRVQARYAGRVRVVVDGDKLVVAGPRVPMGLYAFWIWAQGLTLALVPALLVWALVGWNWRPLAWGFGMLLVSLCTMGIGAGIWPGFGETVLAGEGHFNAVEVPLSRVSDVQVGGGWARDGLQTVVLLYKKGIDPLATNAVTFRAPDGEGHDVVYAIQMFSAEDAGELSRLLAAGGAELSSR